MVSLDHERLLRHIDEHSTSYLERWEYFHTHSSKLSKYQTPQAAKAENIHDQLLPQFQQRGIHTTLLNNDSSFIYGALDSGAPRTLLFYQRYSTNHPGIW